MSGVRSTAVRAALSGILGVVLGVGSSLPAVSAPADEGATTIQLLATNDFHGRLAAAPALAGAVGELRNREPNTLLVGVGDLIGGSIFDSFIAQDRPTLQVMNALDLAVSAVGNHEYDQGHRDLLDRVSKPHDPVANPFGGAQWPYLGANLRRVVDGGPALEDATSGRDGTAWMTQVDGVDVGFVGVVTEDLPMLVRPSGLEGLRVTSAVEETNRAADRLTAAGADVVVALVHEGAIGASRDAVTDQGTAFGRLVSGLDQDVDVIFSGHTHLEYAHVIDGRPVVQGGSYGTHLSRVVLSVDPASAKVEARAVEVLPVATVPAVSGAAVALRAEVGAVVAGAQEVARVRGDAVLGRLDSPARRAVTASGAENRGGESALGNLVAEAHRWATASPEAGAAQIAFMNPGGLRADLAAAGDGTVTYRDAALVQPFANTLMTMQMTGDQLRRVLEEQWQRDESGKELLSRPMRRLGISRGFTYTYDAGRPLDERITGMWLNGDRLRDDRSYAVTAHDFLAGGGDNFRGFTRASSVRDTGQSDLRATVEYIAAHQPVPVPRAQGAVEVRVPGGALMPGQSYSVDVASWSFSAPGSLRDDTVELMAGDVRWATARLDHTVADLPSDDTGRARLTFRVPPDAAAGERRLELRGAVTGTVVPVEVTLGTPTPVAPTVRVTGPSTIYAGRGRATWHLRVAGGHGHANGMIEVRRGGRFITRVPVRGGRATVALRGLRKTGRTTYSFHYSGDVHRSAHVARRVLRVVRTPVSVRPTLTRVPRVGQTVALRVRVRPGRAVPARTSPAVRRTVTGRVRVTVREPGRSTSRVVRLRGARTTVRHTFRGRGRATITVSYLGNSTSAPRKTVVRRTVR